MATGLLYPRYGTGAAHEAPYLVRITVAFADLSSRKYRLTAVRIGAEREQHAEERVADLQRVVAMLLAKNEELRQRLANDGQPQL